MGLQNIFPTSIYTHFVPQNISDKMEEIIIPKIPSLSLTHEHNTNVSVYSSFFSDKPLVSPKEIKPFLNYVESIAQIYGKESNIFKAERINYWIQDYKKGNGHSTHCHPQSTICGTYYIRANENAGFLSFSNPNSSLILATRPLSEPKNQSNQFYNIKPQKGLLVLFPFWLMHKIIPSQEENVIRTSLSFNYY